jgi:hypothetical protein
VTKIIFFAYFLSIVSTPHSQYYQINKGFQYVTKTPCPDLYKGIPTGSSQEILELEVGGLENLFKGDLEAAPILGGVVSGRIHNIPSVKELIDGIMQEAEVVLEGLKSE